MMNSGKVWLVFILALTFFSVGILGCDSLSQDKDARRCAKGKELRKKYAKQKPSEIQLAKYHATRIKDMLKSKGWTMQVTIKENEVFIMYQAGNWATRLDQLLLDVGEAVSAGGNWGDCSQGNNGGMNLPHWPTSNVVVMFQGSSFHTSIPDTYDNKWKDVRATWPHVSEQDLGRQMTEL